MRSLPLALLVVPLALVTFSAARGAAAEDPVGRAVEYAAGSTTCEGWLAYDASATGKRPGVLVIHDWMGPSEFTKDVCRRLVKEGYVAFAADVYGKGVRPSNPQEAGQQASKYKGDRALFRARLVAALDVLAKDERVDRKRVAAIGYCFGGTGAIELARSGADLAGVVSFHGGLDSPTPADGKNVKAKVLALHGADDPFVPAKDLAAFCEELRQARVDWQLVQYGGAVHAFTNPAAGSDNARGAAYDAAADRRSWQAMRAFLAEAFGT